MPCTSQEKARLLSSLRWSVNRGRRWCGIYWRQVFEFDGLTVNAAAIPLYQLQLIEQGTLSLDLLAQCMTERSIDGCAFTAEIVEIYLELWDEAISYALGCRQDSLRALAAGEFALTRVERDEWMDGFWAAKQAYELEYNLSGRSRFWGHLLYNLATELIRLGYGRNQPALRPFAKETPRTSRARSFG